MSKIARVKFIRDKEPNIKALTAKNKVLDGALYVATDTGTLWMGISSSSLIQIKDNINTNTTYNLTKSGSTITLRGSDGSTFNVTDSNTVYGNATASAAGLMSAADKAKLDGVAAGSNHVTVDAELSTTSTNPVQNKVIKSALDGKSNAGHKHVKADITDFPTSMPASDVSAWAKAATKPSYSKAEVGLGNVDNTADSAKSVKYAASAGSASSATTAATANALKVTELTTQNLDDTKTVGLYFAGGTNGVKNKPTGVDAFGLEVKKTAGGYLVQVLTEGNINAMKTWIRQFNASAWSAWAHYFDSNHIPTWSQVSGKPSFATVATSGSYNDLSNKPTIPTIPGSLKNPNALTISLNGTSQGAYDGSAVKNINITASSVGAAASSHTHTKAQITDFPTSMPASDVYSWAKQSSKPSYTISEVSGNLPASRISGTIAAANLPSYVDDVLEYASISKFPTTGESGKIYTALDTNKIYRWSGSAYVVISETIALGTTHSSAGYGDESRAAYNHSTKTSGNPHHVTKADLGLGSVENKSSATIRGELTSVNVTTALGYTPPKTDTNTHYTTRIVAGAVNSAANAATTNGNTHINVTDDNTFRSGVVIKGTGATSVTSDASGNITVHSTDTNTWRPVQNNLTSTATDQSLSAAQGKALNDKFGSYVPTSRTVNGKALSANITLSAGDVGAAPASHSHSYLPLSGGTMTGKINRGAGGSWIKARNNVVVFGTTANSQSYNPVVGQKTSKGAWTVGNLAGDERLVFSYDTDTNFNAGTNSSNTTYLPVGGNSQEIITSATIGSQSVSHANTAGSVAWSNVSGRPSSMPASDVYAWAKASSKPSYSWSEISGRPTIPSVGNGTVTITQNGATKGTFTLNQSGNATIALTDNNTVYSLPAATSSTLGGVKVGSNITNSSGTISLTKANVTAALGYTPPTSDTNTWRPEEVIISSTQPSASTCKLWIKI